MQIIPFTWYFLKLTSLSYSDFTYILKQHKKPLETYVLWLYFHIQQHTGIGREHMHSKKRTIFICFVQYIRF
jgi:hypothetical protein